MNIISKCSAIVHILIDIVLLPGPGFFENAHFEGFWSLLHTLNVRGYFCIYMFEIKDNFSNL
jgi:hypothetical protein